MEVRWFGTVVCACVFQLSFFAAWTSGADSGNNEPMWTGAFEGMERVRLVGCQRPVESEFSLIQLKNNSSTVLVAWVEKTRTCAAPGSHFAACLYDEEQNSVTVKVVVTDLDYGESEVYECSTMYVSGSGPYWVHHNISVAYQVSTTQAPSSTTTTDNPTPRTGQSVSSNEDPLFPASVVIVILTLLVVLVTLTCVLGVFYFRGRRRKRKSRDCDAISVRSGMTDKSFYTVGPVSSRGFVEGGGTGRIMRQYSNVSNPPPGMMAPDVPGSNRVVMQYQRPSDSVPHATSTMTFSDRGYMSGSSVHYQEPWGRALDDPEILSKLSTLKAHSRGVVKIPDFDATPSPLPPSSPTPPSAPPTQETGPAPQEENA